MPIKSNNKTPFGPGYLCFWENGETGEASPNPDPHYSFALIILKIRSLFKIPNSFVGVVDAFQNTLQFNVVSPKEIYLDIPKPKEKGSYTKLCTLDEALAIIEKRQDDLSTLKIDGLQFTKWGAVSELIDSTKSLLSFKVNGNLILNISEAELPCEKTPTLKIDGDSVVEFIDHHGKVVIHHIGTEKGWYHFSIRVYENLACQTDCIITQNEKEDENAFKNGANGIRFQPFFISGAKIDETVFIGQGLFKRGLHYNGQVTNSRITLSGVCDFCHKSFLFHSFHAGFSNAGYFYSGSGAYTLTVSDEVPGCPIALETPKHKELANLEAKLPKAPDGTSYLYKNPFRCPHCKAPFIDLEKHPEERAAEYYGNYFEESNISRFET